MANPKLVQLIVTFYVAFINLFFKIKEAKVDKTYRCQIIECRATGAGRSARSSRDVDTDGGGKRCEQFVEQSARSNLPELEGYLRPVYRICELYYWYLLAKNLIICLLRHETFASWRYLDCFLVGRYTINGRVIQLSSYCACYVAIIRLIWLYSVTRPRPEFRMPCVEFLLQRRAHEPFWRRANLAKPARNGESRAQHSGLLEYRNPFYSLLDELLGAGMAARSSAREFRPRGARQPAPRLRPNRTRAAWDALAGTAVLYCTISATIFVLLAVLFFRMGVPVVLTRRGFEYTYRHCIQWILSEGQGHALGFPYDEFLANRVAPTGVVESAEFAQPAAWRPAGGNVSYTRPQIIREFMLPLRDLVRPSWFHVLRATLDIFETAVLYLEIGLLLNATCFMSVLFSKDILIYCRAIKRRLKRLIVSRESATSPVGSVGCPRWPAEWVTGPVAAGCPAAGSRADTADIQAQVADLLIMIDAYNRYMSLQSICHLIYWFGYSALVSSWLFVPGNESPKLEWYVIHCCTTLFVFLLLVNMSEVKTSCRSMYRLVSVAMGLDQSQGATKNVWLSLLKFYSPRPLYCFTLIGSIEITYMLGLKLLVWLVSALIVASSFFRVYNIN